MQQNRREFLRNLGIALAALMLQGCRSPHTLGPDADRGAWDRLRDAWYGLDQLASDAKDMTRGQKTLDQLSADHGAALDALVKQGELEVLVANDMQAAFEAAAGHVYRANVPLTCYTPTFEPNYRVSSGNDLAYQSRILADLAQKSNIDPTTVAQIQAAIERDMAFISLSGENLGALMNSLRPTAVVRSAWPPLDQLTVDIPPDAANAARILVDLLLRRQ